MNAHNIIQGSDEWLLARCGKVTASRISDVMAKTKTGPSASRANYAAQLIAERLTGTVEPSYSNAAMQWGTDKEPEARAAYAFLHDADVVLVGFFDHPRIIHSGASPDGLVGTAGLVEIKCPNTATHIATLESGKPAGKYVLQMQWQMACTGREWCDFASYDPRLPENMRMFVQRIQRDDAQIAEIEREVAALLDEVAETVARLEARYGASLSG